MTEEEHKFQHVEESQKQKTQLNVLKAVKKVTQNPSIRNGADKEDSDNDYLIEQSFEVIPQIHSATMESKSDEIASEQQPTEDDRQASQNIGAEGSLENRIKRPSDFFARLQSSSSEENSSNNISSSIANAFSSLSSFTSNFSINSNTEIGNNPNSLNIETASTSSRLERITENREDAFQRKAALERKNLISLTKLIVKDLISSSLTITRTIDDSSNAVHLNNYFTLLDRVLKHGLKQNMLSNKSMSLWVALDNLSKYLKESTLMSESVRSLANTRTPDGKIKAWMRLAMMQKKLPEYFNELIAHRNVLLKDIYHDFAFMLNDEASVFAGLIIGVNVIDCNFFVKDANFDVIDDIINLSPYLRNANSYEESDQNNFNNDNKLEADKKSELTAILDQKNYLEEWNKRLETTIVDLQAKIKNLEEQNSKLEMEAKVLEVRILKLTNSKSTDKVEKQLPTSITDAIKSFIKQSDQMNLKQAHDANAIKTTSRSDLMSRGPSGGDVSSDLLEASKTVLSKEELNNDLQNNQLCFRQELHEAEVNQTELAQLQLREQEKELVAMKERIGILESSYRSALEKIKQLERDLEIQTSINADKETTIKIYERDMREKQNQVESLRNSLSDSKRIQSDLSEKVLDINNKLKERIKSVTNLQSNLDKWKLENKTLASRLQDKQTALISVTKDLEKALNSIEELKKYNEKINDELKKERESGKSSSDTLESQSAQISEMSTQLMKLEQELKTMDYYKDRSIKLNKRCKDYEQSLEEIGSQLRESRLEVENLKENSAVFLDSQWMDSKQVKSCTLCLQPFSVTRRKHHCRLCGNVFCQNCSDNKMELASSAKPVRVCDTCHGFLLAKFVKSSS